VENSVLTLLKFVVFKQDIKIILYLYLAAKCVVILWAKMSQNLL